jgi:uncharacterized protein YcfJ
LKPNSHLNVKEFVGMSVKSVRVAAVSTLCVGLALGGCAETSSNKTTAGGVGALAGGILGGVLGNRGGIGTVGGAAVGAMVGFIAGSFVGQLLDDADRAKQDSASQLSLSNGETVRWNSDKNNGVHGYSQTVSSAEAPAKRRPAQSGGCRAVREVSYVDGKEYVEMTEYCRAEGSSGWTRKTA